MLKKNLKLLNLFSLILLFALISCNRKEILVTANINSPNNFQQVIKDSTISYYDDRLIVANTLFKHCTFTNGNMQFKKIYNVRFEDCIFKKNEILEFHSFDIKNVVFSCCSFNSLWIKNSIIKENFRLENCKITELVFDQTTFNNVNIESVSDTIQKIRIQGSDDSKSLTFNGNFKDIFIEGGDISLLDLSHIANSDCKINVFSTLLINPNFVNKATKNYSLLNNISIENATLEPNSNSMLKEEIEWNEKNTKDANSTERSEIKKGLLISKTVYNNLSRKFENERKYDLAG